MNVTIWKTKFISFVGECKRVLKVTKKPDSIEFKTIVKVSGAGILIIGFMTGVFSRHPQTAAP